MAAACARTPPLRPPLTKAFAAIALRKSKKKQKKKKKKKGWGNSKAEIAAEWQEFNQEKGGPKTTALLFVSKPQKASRLFTVNPPAEIGKKT